MENNVTEFILLGLSQEKEMEALCFLLFLLCYITILTGNLIIMVSITCSQFINQPIYFYLLTLILRPLLHLHWDPQANMDFLAEKKAISYNGCMTQLFTMHFLGSIEVFILTVVAYDHDMAICKPLHYTTIMSQWRCNIMIAASCTGGFLHFFGQFLLIIFLPYCGPNEINPYFCDVYPLPKLDCADTSRIDLFVIADSSMMSLVTSVILLISYAVILYTVRPYSVENCRKALSTCSSHITVVALFLFLYSSFIFNQLLLYQKTKLVLFFILLPPSQPYDIHTKKYRDEECNKLWFHIMGKKGNRVKDILDSYH